MKRVQELVRGGACAVTSLGNGANVPLTRTRRCSESQVRDAFNPPFRPFVLALTSVGQEGLDFHHYSHAVVHWNLPSNPVDLEQREGRVHRYRGHAVRKNVARQLGSEMTVLDGRNPLRALFGLATAARTPGQSEIFPDWVYPVDGGASIDRYVPVLPMSRERQQYRRLLRTVGAYRLTLGHPRQSYLLAYVGTDADLALDLAPAGNECAHTIELSDWCSPAAPPSCGARPNKPNISRCASERTNNSSLSFG